MEDIKKKHFILCVDDEPAILEALSEQLIAHFSETHEVFTCTSAEEALETIETLLAEKEFISLVISDQMMPGMKGADFLSIVHKKIPETIKILLTGYAGLDSAIKAINDGHISRYVEKPWDMETAHKDISVLLNKYKETLENAYLLNKLTSHIGELKTKLDENNLEGPALDIKTEQFLDKFK